MDGEAKRFNECMREVLKDKNKVGEPEVIDFGRDQRHLQVQGAGWVQGGV